MRLEKLPAPRQNCLMKGHMSMVLLALKQESSTTNYTNRIIEQLTKISSIEQKLPLLRHMAGTLEYICENVDYLDYGGLSLIGNIFYSHFLSIASNEVS